MGSEQPGELGGGRAFEVFGEAPTSSEPCKGALDDPAPGQELEAFDPGRSLDDLDCPRPAVRECVEELFAAINPIGEDMFKLWEAASQALQQRHSAMDVLNVGGMNIGRQQETVGVGNDMSLASMEALAGVESAWPAGLRRRCGLTIDNGSCRFGLSSEPSARLPNQGLDDLLPSTRIAPGVKIALHRRVWRELFRQGSPLAAARQNIEDRLHDLAQIDLPRPAQSPSRRHHPGDQRPFCIGQITCVTQSAALILDTSGLGPWHGVLPRIFANPKESQASQSRSPFSGQALRRPRSGRLEGWLRMRAGPAWFETALTRLLSMRSYVPPAFFTASARLALADPGLSGCC